jgi:CRP-like cAMP-binding protein
MRLLAHLEQRDRDRLRPHLEPVILEYKRLLYDAYQPIEYVYFLEDGVASLVHTMENGDALEVGTIGNEGVVGLPILLGDEGAPSSVFIQVPGSGMRIEANAFRRELERSGAMRAVLLHYAHAFFNQVAQSAACAHFHALEQRCCRWLLMTRDRVKSDEFLLTQEFLSMMLGVRRAGVSIAAGALQRAGLIRYSRGRITMLDREALEARACECYAVSKAVYNDLLGVADPGNGRPAQ